MHVIQCYLKKLMFLLRISRASSMPIPLWRILCSIRSDPRSSVTRSKEHTLFTNQTLVGVDFKSENKQESWFLDNANFHLYSNNNFFQSSLIDLQIILQQS